MRSQINIKTNKFKNKKGFSLVEVLIVVGLIATASMGIVTMLSNTYKAQRGIQAKDLQREVMAEIGSHLIDRTACFNSFGGLGSNPAAPFTKTIIKDAAGATKYQTTTPHNSNLLQYKEFKIQDWVADVGFPNQGRANLNVTLTKLGDGLGVKDISQKLGLRIKLDASNNILECYSIGSSTDSLWKPTPTDISNIYYDVGNVGIGTTTPTVKLDVQGQIVSRPYDNGASSNFNLNYGNAQYSSASCGPISLTNMVDGAAYTIVLTGGASGTCVFTDFTGGRVFKYSPANTATIIGTETLYSLQVLGTKVYVSWISGY